jgi:hypothetical protein
MRGCFGGRREAGGLLGADGHEFRKSEISERCSLQTFTRTPPLLCFFWNFKWTSDRLLACLLERKNGDRSVLLAVFLISADPRASFRVKVVYSGRS